LFRTVASAETESTPSLRPPLLVLQGNVTTNEEKPLGMQGGLHEYAHNARFHQFPRALTLQNEFATGPNPFELQ
jgi:hypothetical protein